MRSDGRAESRCTVVAVPDEDDFGVYTVQLDGTTGKKQCTRDQMRAVPSTSAASTSESGRSFEAARTSASSSSRQRFRDLGRETSSAQPPPQQQPQPAQPPPPQPEPPPPQEYI